LPSLEHRQDFPGFSLGDVSVEARACGGSDCLVNHFQGRVSCPYGQTAESITNLPPDSPARCRVPGAHDDAELVGIDVPVEPQRLFRNARDNVYCSCRCNGPDPAANYCACPKHYECVELVRELGLPSDAQSAGAYCIKVGTAYDPSAFLPADTCGPQQGVPIAGPLYTVEEVCGDNGNP
jgi:hypothetical protein